MGRIFFFSNRETNHSRSPFKDITLHECIKKKIHMYVFSQIRSLMINNVSLIKMNVCMKSSAFCREACSMNVLQVSVVNMYLPHICWDLYPVGALSLCQFNGFFLTLMKVTINTVSFSNQNQTSVAGVLFYTEMCDGWPRPVCWLLGLSKCNK